MDIKKVDKNFENTNKIGKSNIIEIPSEKVNMFGLIHDKERGFLRMPFDVASKISTDLTYLSACTAGGRIAFRTNTSKIKVNVTYDCLGKMPHMALTGQGGFSLIEFKNNKEFHRFSYKPDFGNEYGFEETSRKLPGRGIREYILYFPLYNKVKTLSLEIDKGSVIEPFNPYKDTLPILYYGSSITQGGCASRPDNSYQSFISKLTRIDHINLGFSGNAKGEQLMADYCAKISCSVFVFDYDHNAPNEEHLRNTHLNFYKTFRKSQPNTPIVILSAPNFYEESKLYRGRRAIIKETFDYALSNGDKNVTFVDGAKIYPSEIRESCSVDGCHPTDLGFYWFAKKLIPVIKKHLNK